jgi:hypothetical protein
VANAVAGIASQPTWNGAKERVRRSVDRDRSLRPISSKVLGFLLEHINRKKVYDWHTASDIATDQGPASAHEMLPVRPLVVGDLSFGECPRAAELAGAASCDRQPDATKTRRVGLGLSARSPTTCEHLLQTTADTQAQRDHGRHCADEPFGRSFGPVAHLASIRPL